MIQTEQEGNKAFDIHQKIVTNEQKRRELLFENAGLIHEMHAKRYYRAILGDDEAPWSGYLSTHELYYSSSKVYTLDKIYQKFVKELNVDIEELLDIPNTKLGSLISIVNKENVMEWLTKARELTSQDFNDELRKATGKISYLECPHKNTKTYEVCSSCGFRHAK